jgi:hypothetical protein
VSTTPAPPATDYCRALVKCTDFSREHLSGNLLLLVNSLWTLLRGLLVFSSPFICVQVVYLSGSFYVLVNTSTLIDFTKSPISYRVFKGNLSPDD